MFYCVFFYVFSLFASLSMFILYDLYFDGIDDIDDDDDEHVGDFNAFFPGHSQYLAFSFDGGGLGGLGDKRQYPFQSIFDVYIRLLDPYLNAHN